MTGLRSSSASSAINPMCSPSFFSRPPPALLRRMSRTYQQFIPPLHLARTPSSTLHRLLSLSSPAHTAFSRLAATLLLAPVTSRMSSVPSDWTRRALPGLAAGPWKGEEEDMHEQERCRGQRASQ